MPYLKYIQTGMYGIVNFENIIGTQSVTYLVSHVYFATLQNVVKSFLLYSFVEKQLPISVSKKKITLF